MYRLGKACVARSRGWGNATTTTATTTVALAATTQCCSTRSDGATRLVTETISPDAKRIQQRNLLAMQRRRAHQSQRNEEGGAAAHVGSSGGASRLSSVGVSSSRLQRGREAAVAAASVPVRSPPLVLDPPFTPIPGEREAAAMLHEAASSDIGARDAGNGTGARVVYACAGCDTALFSHLDLAAGEAPGNHPGGWPSFVATTPDVKLRSVSQRVVAGSASASASAAAAADSHRLHGSPIHHSRRSATPRRGGRKTDLLDGVLPPVNSMAHRGLNVEHDMYVARKGGGFAATAPRTWRETCLRDENQRADPHYIEGYCRCCGKAVCRVVVRHRPLTDEERRDLSIAPGMAFAKASRRGKGPKEMLYITTAVAVRARAVLPS